MKELNYQQIRKLQFLIKKHTTSTEKHKLFSVINLYKQNKNIHLFNFLLELAKELSRKEKLQN